MCPCVPGPSEKALTYFQTLGFSCPEHTNPPDFFMDVISGMEPRQGHPEFKPPDLFELWNDHVKQRAALTAPTGGPGEKKPMEMMSFKEHSLAATIDGRDLSPSNAEAEKAKKRKTASVFHQLFAFTVRAFLQQMGDWQGLIFDAFLVLLSGLFLGLIYYQVTLCSFWHSILLDRRV